MLFNCDKPVAGDWGRQHSPVVTSAHTAAQPVVITGLA